MSQNHQGAAQLRSEKSQAIVAEREFQGEITFQIAPGDLLDTCRFLKGDCGFNQLADVVGSHHPDQGEFRVAYWLRNLDTLEQLRIKVHLPVLEPQVQSLTEVWRGADWLEREQYDFFGIEFVGHPDLRRIMMPDDYPHHPLRKEFPVTGEDSWRNRVPDTQAGQPGPQDGN